MDLVSCGLCGLSLCTLQFSRLRSSVVSHKFFEYLIEIRRRCKRLKHKVPPLRFAPVGMTDLCGEFAGHHTRRLLKKSFHRKL
jgi:hypothetical protein